MDMSMTIEAVGIASSPREPEGEAPKEPNRGALIGAHYTIF